VRSNLESHPNNLRCAAGTEKSLTGSEALPIETRHRRSKASLPAPTGS